MYKVSVLIPTYNRARMLPIAIDSILAQSYSNIETIVVDDGSTDNTETLLKQYHNKIKLIRIPTNKGCAYARNLLLDAACGDYACWQDSDDWSNKYRIEYQLDYLLTSGACLCLCRALAAYKYDERWMDKPTIAKIHTGRPPGTAFFKLADAVQVPLKRSLSGSDAHWLRLMKRRGKFVMMPEVGYYVRIHPDRISEWRNQPNLDWHKRMLQYRINP
jgi:glycosyltransferase involved in cell wall biosynthesis